METTSELKWWTVVGIDEESVVDRLGGDPGSWDASWVVRVQATTPGRAALVARNQYACELAEGSGDREDALNIEHLAVIAVIPGENMDEYDPNDDAMHEVVRQRTRPSRTGAFDDADLETLRKLGFCVTQTGPGYVAFSDGGRS
jgi:hypothetical protein